MTWMRDDVPEPRYQVMVLDSLTPHLKIDPRRWDYDGHFEDEDEARRFMLVMNFKGWVCILWDNGQNTVIGRTRQLWQKELLREDSQG